MKHNIISFDHISEKLTPEEVEKYKKLYNIIIGFSHVTDGNIKI